MLSERADEPCLVKAGQGFSVLYKERFLYSKYSPDRAVLETVAQLEIPDETLVLAFSPCLCYGLTELLQKLPENSFVLAVELEKPLFTIAGEKIKEITDNNPSYNSKVLLCDQNTIESTVETLPCFKRCITVEMSGGTFFNREFYENIKNYIQQYTASFWKNRVTLVKLGRLFSRNFIKNLKNQPRFFSVQENSLSQDRPVIVFGAGESAEEFIKNTPRSVFERCTVFAADAALPVLLKNGLDADFVISVESQLAIEQSWTGVKTKAVLITDMAGRPSVIRRAKEKVLYFYSEYTKASFFKRYKEEGLLPLELPPLGSVGLTAVRLALIMRKNRDIPVLFTGLDFSFSAGFTHARGAAAHTSRLINTNRFKSVENYSAAFKTGAHIENGINGPVITDAALQRYAELFTDKFRGVPNLFDAREYGLPLGIPQIKTQDLLKFLDKNNIENKTENEYKCLYLKKSTQKNTEAAALKKKIKNEKESLLRLKELLSKGNNASPPPSPDLKTELERLLTQREYLYLHFPDGYRCDITNISFLKRVRSEIDFFIKDLS